ncbi:MAG TPA: FAD-dependent oxidoreductase [Candidatus Enterocloster excrementipullorum]|uniref:FAD-dependent oxidoreductase n=1 Tax=Candidatus Enterocloster excrementipullorum TaxID=2838559 RepID=A0A9D2N2K3_9FIRM|nr:FAD-dependent oxidoreductase [Candidatus Enterocloster excrementipullorum]
MKYKNLFTPVTIGSVTIKNRFAMAPMGPLGLADAQGGFNQRGIDYYTERAKGGTGLIITGVTFSDCKVETQSMPNCPNSTFNPVHFIRTGREMTERVHAYGSKIFLMMSAGFGRVTIPTNLGEFPPVAPSAIPHRWLDKICRPLTVEEIHSIVKSFGDGAYNAMRAGFDGVEIHAVHEGYLLDQFAISMFNQRTDEYGGSLENRLRFAREVVEEIKSRCGKDFPVALRFSVKSMIKDWREGALPGEEFEEKGRDVEEGLAAARLLVEYGYDALDTDVGTYDAWWWNHPPMYQKKGLYRPYCRMVKEAVDVPVLCAGRMDNPDMALEALEKGECDIISLSGNLIPGGVPDFKEDDIALADWYVQTLKDLRVPVYLNHEVTKDEILAGDYDAVILATGSVPKRFSLGDDARVYTASQVLLKEKDCGDSAVIVGGGLVGCETALWLRQQGKKVTIVEALDKILAVNGPLCHANKDMLERLVPYRGIQVVAGARVKEYRNGILTADTADGEKAIPCDSVILAVGYREEDSLYRQIEFDVPELYLLGDAKKVSNIMYGIWDAFEVANHI